MESAFPTPFRRVLEDAGLALVVFQSADVELWCGDFDEIELQGVSIAQAGSPRAIRLSVETGGPVDVSFLLSGPHISAASLETLRTGEAEFDARFLVRRPEGDADSIQALLCDEVGRALSEIPPEAQPSYADGRIAATARVDDSPAALDTLRRSLAGLIAAGRAMERAARSLPIPRPLHPFAPAFKRAASELGMRLRDNALMASARVDACTIQVIWMTSKRWRPAHTERGVSGVTACVRASDRLPVDLVLRRAGVGARLLRWVGRGGVRVGDARFERAWSIETTDAGAARDLFQPEVRAHLERVAQALPDLTLESGTLVASGPLPSSPDTIPALLPSLMDLARAFSLHGRAHPFR